MKKRQWSRLQRGTFTNEKRGFSLWWFLFYISFYAAYLTLQIEYFKRTRVLLLSSFFSLLSLLYSFFDVAFFHSACLSSAHLLPFYFFFLYHHFTANINQGILVRIYFNGKCVYYLGPTLPSLWLVCSLCIINFLFI